MNAVLLSAGAAFDQGEAERITAPGGTVITTAGKQTMPENPAYDDWSHFRANAHGTGIANDTAVAPSNRLGWMNQGMFPSNMRTIEGVVASDYAVFGETGQKTGFDRLPIEAQRFVGRDVFSGVRLWQHGEVPSRTWLQMRENFAAHATGFIHLPNKLGQPMVRTDPHSGEITMVYDQGLLAGQQSRRGDGRLAPQGTGSIIVTDEYLLQGLNKQIALLDVVSGKRHWKIEVEEYVARVAIALDSNTVYVQERPQEQHAFGPRWGASQTAALTAYNLNDGSLRWRKTFEKRLSPESTPRRYKVKRPQLPLLTALVEIKGTLYAYDQEANLGGDGSSDIYGFNVQTGEQLFLYEELNHNTSTKRGGHFYTNNMVVWHDELYHRRAKLPMSADATPDWSAVNFRAGNIRCVRLSGSTNYLMNGFNAYFSRDGSLTYSGLSRGNCGMPNYVGYGAVLSAADQTCGCYNGIRAHAAYLPPERAPFTIIDDSKRLTTPQTVAFTAHDSLPDGPLQEDMFQVHQVRYVWEQRHQSVSDDGLNLDIDMQQHAITASGDASWQYRADGRLYYAPTITDDIVYVSSTAGTVTALDRTTGVIRWRFLAAPGYERAVVNGQIESRWPAVNTILNAGKLYVAAGRHAELDGGLWLWTLDPATGAIQEQARIFQPMTRIAASNTTSGPRATQRFRTTQAVARLGLLFAGLQLTDDGQVALVRPRWNKKGSASSNLGYWLSNEGKKGKGTPAPEKGGSNELLPINMAALNGTIQAPLEIFTETHKGKKVPYDRDEVWRGAVVDR